MLRVQKPTYDEYTRFLASCWWLDVDEKQARSGGLAAVLLHMRVGATGDSVGLDKAPAQVSGRTAALDMCIVCIMCIVTYRKGVVEPSQIGVYEK